MSVIGGGGKVTAKGPNCRKILTNQRLVVPCAPRRFSVFEPVKLLWNVIDQFTVNVFTAKLINEVAPFNVHWLFAVVVELPGVIAGVQSVPASFQSCLELWFAS